MLDVAWIEKESSIDGEGVRCVVFVQGCKHKCLGCHNPQTHQFGTGTKMEISEIVDIINENPLLDGITLSGGDPFFQALPCKELADACKQQNLTVWAYTGFIFEEFLKFINNEKCNPMITSDMIELLKSLDVVVDGPFVLDKKTLNCVFRGSSNQRIIDVQKSLTLGKVVEYKLD